MTNWREKIDPSLKQFLEIQIKEAFKHRKVYRKSSDPKNSQLWVAIANLSKQIFDLELKTKYLERALKDSLMIKKESSPEQELKEIMSVISTQEKLTKPKKTTKKKRLKKK